MTAARHTGVLTWAMLALVAPHALANGRYPTADHLSVDPADPTHLALRATFGLLLSDDGGASWRWICEEALGYSGQLDPSVEVDASGAIAVGYRRALLRSNDAGCTWQSAAEGLDDADVVDLVVDPNSPEITWMLLRDTNTGEVRIQPVGGAAGQELAPVAERAFPATIELAQSDAARRYVSGLDAAGRSVVWRSSTGGESWESFEVTARPTDPAYISGVAPADADRLYLRVDGETEDALLVSHDGGETFEELLALATDLLGFGLSPDGTRLAVGGPDAGVWLADTETLEFAPSPHAVQYLSCLRWTTEGLLACAREANDGWTIARSTDDGNSFEPLFQIADLQPQSCDPGTITASRCSIAWHDTARVLGIGTEEPEETPPSEPADDSWCQLGAHPPRASTSWLLLLVSALWIGHLRRLRRGSAVR